MKARKPLPDKPLKAAAALARKLKKNARVVHKRADQLHNRAHQLHMKAEKELQEGSQ